MLTRRGFLTGLGLGGVVVATPPIAKAFLDVGKATREGEARFKLKLPDERQWSPEEEAQLTRDLAAHQMQVTRKLDTWVPADDGEDYEGEWWRVDKEHREGLRISYRDTYIDKTNGDIWTVDPETNIATKTAAGTTRASLSSSLLVAMPPA